MKEADIALARLPQADGILKPRPIIILHEMPKYRDLLVCGISTQLHQEIKNFDEIISPNDADFAGSGLKAESLIRVGSSMFWSEKTFLGKLAKSPPKDIKDY